LCPQLFLAFCILLASACTTASPVADTGSASGNGNRQHAWFEESKPSEATLKAAKVKEMVEHVTLAGSLTPFVRRLFLSKEEFKHVLEIVSATVHWEDLTLILMLGWLSVPALKFPYEKLKVTTKPFRQSYTFVVADLLQQVAKIALAVYLMDIVKLFCIGMGFDFCKMKEFPHAFAHAAYTLWLATRVSTLKKHLLRQYVSRHPDTYGRAQILNRVLDSVILAGCLLIFFNILQVCGLW
jgi:hypothetical protein